MAEPTRTVELAVELPESIAEQAEQLQHEDPAFLSRVVLYGLTRRGIYRYLKNREGVALG